tara:strand:+ start:82 stop:327 length:246 start_codon:yes stop_codon:yes gene_type:complete
MNLSITKAGVKITLIMILFFLAVSGSISFKVGALLLGITIMIWATFKVKGFYQKPDKKNQAFRLSIIGCLALLVLAFYNWA